MLGVCVFVVYIIISVFDFHKTALFVRDCRILVTRKTGYQSCPQGPTEDLFCAGILSYLLDREKRQVTLKLWRLPMQYSIASDSSG